MPYKLYCKIIVFALTAIVFASCVSQKGSVTSKHKTQQEDIIEYGKKYLHKPYSFSGKGPYSFDCSGFTSFVFKEFGYKLNSSSAGQAQQGIKIDRKEELQVGDLVFFEGRSHNGRVGHVGIVSEVKRNGKFKFLHASTNYGVIFSSSEEPYYKDRYLSASRVLKDVPKPKEKSKQQQTSDTYLARNKSPNSGHSINEELPSTTSQQKTTQLAVKESGTLTIHSRPATPNENVTAITPHQANKPVIKKKEQEKEKKKPESKKLNARSLSEESILPPPIITTHVVKPGETLFSISQKYKCSVDELQAWNPTVENSIIKAGDTLKIQK